MSEIHLEKECVMCKEKTTITLTLKEAERISEGKELIQNIVPNMAPELREMFISGVCGKCFDNMFKI